MCKHSKTSSQCLFIASDESFNHVYKKVTKNTKQKCTFASVMKILKILKILGLDGNLRLWVCVCVCTLAVCFSWYFERAQPLSVSISGGDLVACHSLC